MLMYDKDFVEGFWSDAAERCRSAGNNAVCSMTEALACEKAAELIEAEARSFVEGGDAVEAEPVVHAKVDWRLRHHGGFATVTGFVLDEEGCLTKHRATVRIDMRNKGREPYCGKCGKQLAESSLNYCPHCGAKMDEVSE